VILWHIVCKYNHSAEKVVALSELLVVSTFKGSRAVKSQALLILGSHRSQEYVEALSSIGFVPEVRGSVQHSLDKVRRQRFSGVIVDRKFTHADVLEFILNVRDINRTIPVVVIGLGKNERIEGKIVKQDHTRVLDEFDRGQTLARELAHAFRVDESENV
jgi:hypothetical protein